MTVLVIVCLRMVARRNEGRAQWLCRATAMVLLLAEFGSIAVDAMEGVSWRYFAPFHLCDVVVFIGAFALWTGDQRAFELSYFWGLVGAPVAMLTPELSHDFPHFRFIFYFLQHGSIVLAALLLSAGIGMRPRRWSAVRAWLSLNVYAALVGIIDGVWGTNFMFLRAPPAGLSPLGWFGEWPWYLVVSDALALLLFLALYLPFWRDAKRSPEP